MIRATYPSVDFEKKEKMGKKDEIIALGPSSDTSNP